MPKDAPEPIHLPAELWWDPSVLALCRDHDANGLFRLAKSYGISNERLAYWVGTEAGEISKRINDRISGPIIAINRWLRIADGLNMPDRARRAAGLASHPSSVVSIPRSTAAVPNAGLRLTEGVLMMAADESAQFAEWAEAANAGRFSVDQLAAELRRLSVAYLTGSPVPVFIGTRAVRDKAVRLLQGHSAPARARDLYTVAGYACTLLAWISGDLGQLGAAETHGRTAWVCAELADSPELRAWVLSTQSKNAFWDRRLSDAVEFARAGQAIGRTTSVGVLLAAQEADAASQMGRTADAWTALGVLADARDAVDRPDEVGGLLSCDTARQGNYAAAVYVRTGRPGDALREAHAALSQYRDGDGHARGTEMQLHISRALGHLHGGALDGAAEALGTVLTAPPDERLAPVAGRLGEVTTALLDHRFTGSRVADSMREAITDYRSVALPLPPAIEESPGDDR